MATLTTNSPLVEREIPRKIWTREEAHMLLDLGFPNAERLEVIDGELIDHLGKKRPHVIWQHRIQEWLQKTFGSEYVEMEASIDVALDDNRINEPEPDLIVTLKTLTAYPTDNVPSSEIRLLIEIADTTVRFDLHKKANLYAKAAIVEYWVVDIPQKLVHVHRAPDHGTYTSIVKYGFGEEISPVADPNARVLLDHL